MVLRHSSHRHCCRAARVGQPVGSGTYLPPPASLYRLRDPPLKPAPRPMHPPPIHGMPVQDVVGDRTSHLRRLRGCGGRHLLCLRSRLGRRSRDERPDGSLSTVTWGHVASGAPPLPPIPGGPSLLPSSSTRSPLGGPDRTHSRAGALRAYQVPLASPKGDGAPLPPVWLTAQVTGHITP
jgi:hypothetical protein